MKYINTRTEFNRELLEVKNDVKRLMSSIKTDLVAMLASFSTADGKIRPGSSQEIRKRSNQIVQSRFTLDSEAFAQDGVTALTPYAEMINKHLVNTAADVVAKHSEQMSSLPQPIQSWLKSSRQTANELSIRNPFVDWVLPHFDVGPDQLVLSQRIWKVGQETSRRIDAVIQSGIRQGLSTKQIATSLEQFLNPDKKLIRGGTALGKDVSYHAMLLARTEVAKFNSRVTFAAASANPYVSGMDWALHPRHPRVDICDALATISANGQRMKDPYPLESAPRVVEASHPFCICSNVATITEEKKHVQEYLEQKMKNGDPAPLTPLDSVGFLTKALGNRLLRYGSRLLTR